mgnify:CR=1 FL=1
MKCIKKYWWILILIIILPTMVNLILVTPTPCSLTIAGNNVDWLSFWGCYLGAIISTGSAFIILAVQYKQNHIENSKNRELQKMYYYINKNASNYIALQKSHPNYLLL